MRDARTQPLDLAKVGAIIRPAKALAKRYRALTGRPLGITGEVAEYEAARLLGLELAAGGQRGYDAFRRKGKGKELIQIKGRCLLSRNPGHRLPKIDLQKEWDTVVFVLLDPDLEPTAIYEARRPEIRDALMRPGSRARNERGALSVSKFKAIGKLVWSRSV